MIPTNEDGRQVIFKGKHPHAGETGTILGADKTIAGTGYLVELDNGERCFLFNPEKEADLIPERKNVGRKAKHG